MVQNSISADFYALHEAGATAVPAANTTHGTRPFRLGACFCNHRGKSQGYRSLRIRNGMTNLRRTVASHTCNAHRRRACLQQRTATPESSMNPKNTAAATRRCHGINP
jgi:hypothetical protein